jgi:predicted nucleic acid-binding protein
VIVVVDASVLAPALADDGIEGGRARERLRGRELAAPALVDLEVASVIRRAHRAGALDEHRAKAALADLVDLPMGRAPHGPLLGRIWALRENLTVYDAAYVALAEALEVPLLTADRALAATPGARCSVELVTSG